MKVIVFARAPRFGRVKRRLAAEIGDIAALAFYRRNLSRLIRRLRGFDVIGAVTPDGARIEHLPCIPQGRGDLGRRMANAMIRVGGPCILVGGDIPDLGARHIRQAQRALRSADAVFGPARDGGYYLVALRRPGLARWMFTNVRWSSPYALADTLRNLRHRRVALIDTLADVDRQADLKRS